jgi:LmbE family N-acetylglucosaminyl deacetylase
MKNIAQAILVFVTMQMYAQQKQIDSQPHRQLRIIVFGAHPDDCDVNAGGLAALYVSMGHAVKFVSLTNGDKGHQQLAGQDLTTRRLNEAKEAGRRLGVEYEVMNNHDGELLPTLENRLEVIRRIREWKADIVITHRPNDYHPDHRYTAILVQDAAYMVIVPAVLSNVPPLKSNPLFLYFADRFQRPNPFRPDIAIDITDTFAKKIDALDAHTSQFYEWLPWTGQENVPSGLLERKKWLSDKRMERNKVTPVIRKLLKKWYGSKYAGTIKLAEAFEICEYGLDPNEEEIRQLFPMLAIK